MSTHRKKTSLLKRADLFRADDGHRRRSRASAAGPSRTIPGSRPCSAWCWARARNTAARAASSRPCWSRPSRGASSGTTAGKPGVYKVKITEVKLDPKLFTAGRTVDIQARVRKIDGEGKETTVWESKALRREARRRRQGRPASPTGRGGRSRSTGRPATKVVVEVWDRKGGFFGPEGVQDGPPRARRLPAGLRDPRASRPPGRTGSTHDSDLNRIVFQSRAGGRRLHRHATSPKQVAERPIVIK